jgi:predicted O-methyltransferase YrrM
MPALSKKVTELVQAQAMSSFVSSDAQLDSILANSKSQGLPEIQISPLQGQLLSIECQLVNAKTVLEVGTLGGYSTTWFARTGAKVTSIEIDPKHRAVALENTKGLDVEIILGAALDVLPQLAAEGRKFDFIFLDASWDEQWQYFDWAIKLTRSGGAIHIDNVVAVMGRMESLDADSETLITRVGKDERVTATLVPTLGIWEGELYQDGFILALVK